MILLIPPAPRQYRIALGSVNELIANLSAQPNTRRIATLSRHEAARFETFGTGVIVVMHKGIVHLEGNRHSARLALVPFIGAVEVA